MFAKALRRLPEKPAIPHNYYELEDKFCEVKVKNFVIKTRYKELGIGKPLVLVHGLMTSSYSWRYNIQELSKHFRVIVPDLVGCGLTDKPIEYSYTPYGVAEFLHAFLGAIGVSSAYVVGNSLGGLYVLAWANKYPSDFLGLIVEHSPGFFQFRLFALKLLLKIKSLVSRAQRLIHQNRMGFVAMSMHYEKDGILSIEEVREYASLFEDMQGTQVFFKILKESLDTGEMRRVRKDLAKTNFNFPTRLVFAVDDKLVPPKFGKKFARLLGVPIIWVRESSHFIHVDQPQRFHELVLEVFSE